MYKHSKIILSQSSTIVLLFLALFNTSVISVARAATDTQPPIFIHGPICVWHHDPLTECSLVWIERPNNPQPGWFEAKAGFGYSDDDDATVLEMKGQHRAVYIRKVFSLTNALEVDSLSLDVLYDDGFVAFLNGHELVRAGVSGDIGKANWKNVAVENHEAKKFETFANEDFGRWLRDGENVLAIVGLNKDIDSTDLSLHPSLKATVGGQDVTLIERSETWQVLLGGRPERNWMMTCPNLSKNNSDEEDPKEWELELRYCSKGSGDWKSAKIERHPMADSGSTVGTAFLQKLDPGTEYQIEMNGSLSGERVLRRAFSMKTAPAKRPRKMNFVNGGDMFHTRDLLDAMNRQAGKLDPMFALLGGDLAYANARDADRWYQWFDSWYENAVTDTGRQIPMIAVIGNHESQGVSPDRAKFYYSLFPLPEGRSNFVVNFGNYMSIVNLDSDHSQPVGNQTQWLSDTLEKHRSSPLLFACYHRPTYGTLVKEDNAAVRTQWVPLFEKYKVDTVFEHDHHVYKRSLPIYQGRVDNRRGVLYMGDGAWGVSVREIPGEHGEKLPYIERAASRNHLIHVLIDGAEVHYHATEANGNVFDRYSRKH